MNLSRPWNHGDASQPFSVTEWGSDPAEDNDDCWCGGDFATLEEARADLQETLKKAGKHTAYVLLDGPGVYELHPVPAFHTPEAVARRERERLGELRQAREEAAWEAGMAFGCDGYNDVMGW